MHTRDLPHAPRRESIGALIAWGLMTLLALAIGAYGLRLLFVPAARPPFIADSPVPLATLLHFGGGALALLLGPWQFRTGRTRRRSAVHRWMGRAYAASVFVGVGAGLLMAPFAMFGTVSVLGFGGLAVATLGTTVRAWQLARQGDFERHREWMVRSFALIYAAVTLRFQIPLSMMLELPFAVAYPVIAWACWVPNLLVAEWLVRRGGEASARPAAQPAAQPAAPGSLAP